MSHTKDQEVPDRPASTGDDDVTTKRVLSVKVTEPLGDALDSYAEHLGRSRSSVVREAVQEYLVRGRRSGSFREQAADLHGSVEGPEDLSTNPEHLRGYGA